jgi:hypothetical protein
MGTGMKKALRYATAFFLLIEVLAVLGLGLAAKGQQQITLGVYPGESFVYGTPNGSPWVSMSPYYAPPLSGWTRFENLSTISFGIINDSNPSMPGSPGYSFNETVKFRNGTAPEIAVGTLDLETGAGLGITFFIPPHLSADSQIYPANSNFTWTVNATMIDTGYWSGRQVCVLNYTVKPSNSSYESIQRTVVYWDWNTGVLLGTFEEAATVSSSGASVQGVLLYELISNNIGIPMDYPAALDMTPIYLAIFIGVVLVLVIAAVWVAERKPKKKHKRLEQ